MAERPDWHQSWPEVPDGCEVVAIIDPDWEVARDGQSCRFRGGRRASIICTEPAAAVLTRGIYRKSRWPYCPGHMYGRWVEEGFVMHWILAEATAAG